MTLREYAELGGRMRQAQKRYFKQRDNLDECKKVEREFDAATEQVLRPGLFDAAEGETDS